VVSLFDMIKILYITIFLLTLPAHSKTNSDLIKDVWDRATEIEDVRESKIELQQTYYAISDPRNVNLRKLFYDYIKPNFNRAKLIELSEPELHKLFMIISKLSFYTQEDDILNFFNLLLKQVSSENLSLVTYARTLRSRYVANWMFSEALELESEYNLLGESSLIELEGEVTKARQVVIPSLSKGKLRNVDNFNHASHVVIVGSPFCTPSERFTNWLNKNQELKKVIVENSVWITKQNGDLRIKETILYNSTNDNVPYSFVYKEAQWPSVTYWGTPTLYFFDENNNLVRQVVGWPREGREKSLLEALSAINLL